jgi:hypothetical protein
MSRTGRVALATVSVACGVSSAAPSIAAGTPHVVKGPYLTGLSEERVDLRFELDAVSPASVVVASETSHAQTVTDVASSMHALRVAGLQPGTEYTYEVRVAGAVAGKGHFATAPRPEPGATARFLVYGDDRSDETAHAALVRALQATPSDFLVNTGDIVADGGNAADWQSFFQVEASLLRERALFLAIGNHELYDDEAGATFARYFGFAGAGSAPAVPYGTMRWGPTRFFFLNGMHDWQGGDEREWLEGALRRSDGEAGVAWRVVVVHHGPWSSGPHGGNEKLLDARVPELLAAHKVDLVLAGHDHLYERGQSGSIKYVISGGGGAPLYPIAHRAPTARKTEPAYHFVELRATSEAMQLVAHRVDGTILDQCGFRTGEGWDCDHPEVDVPPTGGRPVSSSERPAESPSRCSCQVPGQYGWGGVGALGSLVAVLGAAIRRRIARTPERKARERA